MSVTSEELNYLVWRYLQETGHEVSALALQEESRVLEFEERFKEHIPLGCLVHLVQKGILYTESELLVPPNGDMSGIDEDMYKKNFTLVQALEVDKQKYPELAASERFALENDQESKLLAQKDQEEATGLGRQTGSQSSSGFIKTLTERYRIPQSFASEWNPTQQTVIAFGGADSQGFIGTVDTNPGVDTWSISETIELVHPKEAGAEPITCTSWAPDGDSLLTGRPSGELRLWNKSGKLKNILDGHRSPVVAIKWNQDGTHLLTTDVTNVVILWSTLTGTQLQHLSFDDDPKSTRDSLGIDLEWIETDKYVVPGPETTILVYSIGDNKPLGRLSGHTATITALEFNTSNKTLLSASDDETIKVWKGGNSKPSVDFIGHTKAVSSAHWINEDLIASTSYDGTVKVWSLSKRALVAESTLDSEPIFEASLSPDKKWLAIGTLQGSAIILDIKTLIETLNSSTGVQRPNISIHAEFQIEDEGLQITNISWSKESTAFAVSYINGNTTLLSI